MLETTILGHFYFWTNQLLWVLCIIWLLLSAFCSSPMDINKFLRRLTVAFSPRGSFGFWFQIASLLWLTAKQGAWATLEPIPCSKRWNWAWFRCHRFKTQESICDPYANVILDICRVQSMNLQTVSGQGLRLASRIKSSWANIP